MASSAAAFLAPTPFAPVRPSQLLTRRARHPPLLCSSSPPPSVPEDPSPAPAPAPAPAPVVCHRSKMILTRRVFSWTLRKRRERLSARVSPLRRKLDSAAPAESSASAPSSPDMLSSLLSGPGPLPASPRPLEAALAPHEPVPTFVFQRGIVSFHNKRRSGDPPCRYLELSYGLVEPFSPAAANCSNPRAFGALKTWYQKAKYWDVLHSDFRPTLVLGQDRRRFAVADDAPASGSGGLRPNTRQKTSGNGAVAAGPDTAAADEKAGASSPAQRKPQPTSWGGPTPDASAWRTEGTKTLTTGGSVPRRPLHGGGVPMVVQSSWARALGQSPRLIVIGDVHGCITELQQLLRLADYQPGDQVVLLGDLVAKGPDSIGVVKLAREIGARTVRGNHDFEVVRWWESQVRGDRQAMVSMEHARIARGLGADEHAWLVESPWFIECAEMGHLFVHAGFIPGVKLTQQNPRLMMNMRSVLGDGTVTAKNVADCEWAKLWRGPQTVVFGHDAFRGLQQYEYATGIDTGCVYGGRLTALLLPENRMISVAAKRAYISPKKFRTVAKPE